MEVARVIHYYYVLYFTICQVFSQFLLLKVTIQILMLNIRFKTARSLVKQCFIFNKDKNTLKFEAFKKVQ